MRDNTLRWWLLALVATLSLVPVSFHWLDMQIASRLAPHFARLHHVGDHLGSPLLVGGETLVVMLLAGSRILVGRLPELAKVLLVACATSLCAFALNEYVLKMVFGVAPPIEVVAGIAVHAVRPFQGSWQSSFPSGHMALASGFAATFLYQDRRLLALLVLGLAGAAALLILGSWHFLSDVIAGVFVGGTAGVLAAALWRQDRRRLRG